MNLDELLNSLQDDSMPPPEQPVSLVKQIINVLAAFEVRYGMTSREFQSKHEEMTANAASGPERLDYAEWSMMFEALMEQAPQVKRSIRKRRPICSSEVRSERPAQAGLCTFA